MKDEEITIAWTPGSFEIPVVARKMAASGKYDAVIALGAVIRGSTPHFDYVAAEVSKGVAHVALDAEIPVLFGVLTTDTIEQAGRTRGHEERKQGVRRGCGGDRNGQPHGAALSVISPKVRRAARERAVQFLYESRLHRV